MYYASCFFNLLPLQPQVVSHTKRPERPFQTNGIFAKASPPRQTTISCSRQQPAWPSYSKCLGTEETVRTPVRSAQAPFLLKISSSSPSGSTMASGAEISKLCFFQRRSNHHQLRLVCTLTKALFFSGFRCMIWSLLETTLARVHSSTSFSSVSESIHLNCLSCFKSCSFWCPAMTFAQRLCRYRRASCPWSCFPCRRGGKPPLEEAPVELSSPSMITCWKFSQRLWSITIQQLIAANSWAEGAAEVEISNKAFAAFIMSDWMFFFCAMQTGPTDNAREAATALERTRRSPGGGAAMRHCKSKQKKYCQTFYECCYFHSWTHCCNTFL